MAQIGQEVPMEMAKAVQRQTDKRVHSRLNSARRSPGGDSVCLTVSVENAARILGDQSRRRIHAREGRLAADNSPRQAIARPESSARQTAARDRLNTTAAARCSANGRGRRLVEGISKVRSTPADYKAPSTGLNRSPQMGFEVAYDRAGF
jgi:hypothetical protein